jgi:catechol 2,3-dioxygenase-like lactoylglutathione lyase family enzyme
VAFGVRESELPAWETWLGEHGVAIEQTIDWPDGGRSLYFRDPAGNSLELATPRIWGLDERTLA